MIKIVPRKDLIAVPNHRQTKANYLIIAILLMALPALSSCSTTFGGSDAEEAPVELAAYDPNIADAAGDQDTSEAATLPETNVENQDDASASTTAAESEGRAANDSTTAVAPILVRGEYNGEVVAESSLAVVGEVGGMALEVTVEVGDRVDMGDLLVSIDSTMLEAQRAQALAQLEGAQAQLEQIQRSADPEDLEAADAAVNAAAAAYQDARAGADVEDLTIAESQRRQSEAAVRRAQSAYNEVRWRTDIGALPQSLALEQATLQLEAAKAQFQKILNGAGDNIIAGAYAQLVGARTQRTNLEEGAKPEQIRAVESQVKQAEVALYMAQLQLDKATVEAPMSGIVLQVNMTEGGMVGPGTPLIVIMSDDVEVTIPVEEARLSELSIGQDAFIRTNAYPDSVFEGEVVKIAPQLNPQTRTVQVTIRPTEATDKLMPGMFAAVDLVE